MPQGVFIVDESECNSAPRKTVTSDLHTAADVYIIHSFSLKGQFTTNIPPTCRSVYQSTQFWCEVSFGDFCLRSDIMGLNGALFQYQ